MDALPITLIPAPDESAIETVKFYWDLKKLYDERQGRQARQGSQMVSLVAIHISRFAPGASPCSHDSSCNPQVSDEEAFRHMMTREAVSKELLQARAAEDEAHMEQRLQLFRAALEAYPDEARFSLTELQTLAIAVGPALCTALGAWLGSRNGRKVRIRIGDIEAEAQTQEQVEKLLGRAQEIQQEIQQRNQPPKVIP